MKKKIALRIKEMKSLTIFFISKVISYILPRLDVWLISERGHEARDNAFIFFEYIQKEHPEINAKYIISYDSKDVERFNDKTKLVKFVSMVALFVFIIAALFAFVQIALFNKHTHYGFYAMEGVFLISR